MKLKLFFIKMSSLLLMIFAFPVKGETQMLDPYCQLIAHQVKIDIGDNNNSSISLENIALTKSAIADTVVDTIKTAADLSLKELGNVQISPFNVSTIYDLGYRASNSVSGSHFDAPIQKLPFAIQAFTGSFIDDQKPVNIFDVMRYSPGVTYRSNDFNEGNANLTIRGFTIGSIAGGNIQVLRDGFYGPSIFDFTNIARVEVVKGPSSFLYGQVAPGGIVNIITKNPQPTFSSSINAAYGLYNQYRFDGDVTGPILNNLFYRLAASYNQDIHYWKPYDGYSWDVAPSLLWQPDEIVSLSIKYEHFSKIEEPQVMQKPGYNTQVGVLPTESDPNLSGVDVPGLPDDWNSMSFADYRHSNTNGISAWLDFKINDHWDLRTAYSYHYFEVDALFSGNFGMSNNTTFLQGRRFRGQTYTNNGNTYEAKALGKYKFSNLSLQILLGAQYINRDFINWAAQAPNDTSLGIDPIASPLPLWDLRDPSTWNRVVNIPRSALTENKTDYTINYIDKSIYGGTTFGFFEDQLLVLAGLRLTSTESEFTNHIINQSQPKSSTSMVTPQFGVLYKIIPGISFYASYAESFIPGTNRIGNFDGTTRIPEPTKGQGYDIGIKADLIKNRISGTLTFFNITNKNIVNDIAYTDSTGSVKIYGVQSGKQRSTGIEMDATVTMSDDWQIYLSYSYMDAKITEFSGNDDEILSQNPYLLDNSGQRNYKNVKRFHNAPLQMSAPHLGNLWTRYSFSNSFLKGIYIAGGFNYVYDQTLLPDAPQSAHQTYTLLNMLIGYSFLMNGLNMNLDVMGKNLLNEHYRPSQSTRSRPCEVLLTLTVRF